MRARGFTLVELTVVILIIGLMATIVVPRALSVRDSGRTRETAAKLVAAVESGRQLARSRGARIVVGLDAEGGRVSVADANEEAEDRFEGDVRIPGTFTVTNIDRTETQGQESKAADGETLSVFFEDGTAEPATAELTIGDRAQTLRVSGDGTVTLGTDLEPEPEPESQKWQAGDLEQRA